MPTYDEIVENLKNNFNNFTVYQSGILLNENILFLIEGDLKEKLNNDFVIKVCGGLEATGIKFNQWDTIFVEDFNDKEKMLEIISGCKDLKYFLMIGSKAEYGALMKSLKYITGIKGNYRNFNKIVGYMNDEYIFKLCLEINKQCRGINYRFPANFPVNTAFIHLIYIDNKIYCGTNATKFELPHIMILCQNKDGMNCIDLLEHLCSKLTGKLQHKSFDCFIVTFENYLSTKTSHEIGKQMYDVVEKWIAFAEIGIAEIILKKQANNEIESCEAIKYSGDLNSLKILELLNLCKNCNDLKLNVDDETTLPEPIRLAHIHYNNIKRNYTDFVAPTKNKVMDKDLYVEEDDYMLPNFFYPKIKQRNHVMIPEEDDDFVLY